MLASDPGIAGAMPGIVAADGSSYVLIQAVPTVDPSDPALSATVDRLRTDLPSTAVVGGAAVENLDLKTQLDASTPLVIGVILALGFLLLLVALQAPLIALLGTLASLLSTAAAFGVARLVFQEGWGSGFLGFEHQGFLDAWAPVFFFAMIFAIAMDYTVFLLASAKEHYEHSGDPKDAMVGSLAHSGRVIFAAGAVMVAVFFTFAALGPAAAQGDGDRARCRRAARRLPGPAGPAAGAAPADRSGRLVGARLAHPRPARHPLLPQLTPNHHRRSTNSCVEQSPARPAASPPGPAAVATSSRPSPGPRDVPAASGTGPRCLRGHDRPASRDRGTVVVSASC